MIVLNLNIAVLDPGESSDALYSAHNAVTVLVMRHATAHIAAGRAITGPFPAGGKYCAVNKQETTGLDYAID